MENMYLKEIALKDKEENFDNITRKIEKNSKRVYWRRLIAIATVIIVLVIGIPKGYAQIKFYREFKEFERVASQSAFGRKIDSEIIEMQAIRQDGITAKVTSILVTPDEMEIEIEFEIDDKIEVNTEFFSFSTIVYDENKNVYGVFAFDDATVGEKVLFPLLAYKELGIKYNKDDIYEKIYADRIEVGSITAKDRTITASIKLNTYEAFPKTEKLKILITDIGSYSPKEKEFKINYISKSKWYFDIDIPDKFYYADYYNLKTEEQIEGFNIQDLRISDSSLTIKARSNYIENEISEGKNLDSNTFSKIQDELIFIEDEKGNRVTITEMASGKEGIRVRFALSKEDFENNIFYLGVTIEGKTYKKKLIKE